MISKKIRKVIYLKEGCFQKVKIIALFCFTKIILFDKMLNGIKI